MALVRLRAKSEITKRAGHLTSPFSWVGEAEASLDPTALGLIVESEMATRGRVQSG